MNTINSRIKKIIEYKFDNNTLSFSKHIGENYQTIRNIVGERNSKPSSKILASIISSIDYIYTKWLLTGEGEMFKCDSNNINNNNQKRIIMKGKRVIVRGDRSGVFFGTLESYKGKEVKLSNVRKLHYWDGANAVEEISLIGSAKPKNCRFTVFVPEIIISDMIQIIPCAEKSVKTIEAIKEWKH